MDAPCLRDSALLMEWRFGGELPGDGVDSTSELGNLLSDDLRQLIGLKSRVQSFADYRLEPLGDQTLASIDTALERFGAYGQPFSANRLQDAIDLKLLKRAVDRIGINGQLLAERTNAWQQLTWPERLLSDRKFDLANDLFVDRHAVVRVN